MYVYTGRTEAVLIPPSQALGDALKPSLRPSSLDGPSKPELPLPGNRENPLDFDAPGLPTGAGFWYKVALPARTRPGKLSGD